MKITFFVLILSVALCRITYAERDELDDILDQVQSEAPVKKALPPLPEPDTSESTNEDSSPNEDEELPEIMPELSENVTQVFTETEEVKEQQLEAGLEETTIYQMQVMRLKKEGDENYETLRIPIPVYYRTRSIAWDSEALRQALNLQQRVTKYLERLKTLKEEGEMIRQEYERLILVGIPEEILTSNSPSIPLTSKPQMLGPKPLLRNSDISITVDNP